MFNYSQINLLLIIQLLGISFLSAQNTLGLLSYVPDKTYEGYNLIFPHSQSTVYLLNNCGQLVHTWEDEENFRPGNTVYILENGNLIKCKRTAASVNDPIWAGGGGAIVEIRTWDNELLWSFEQNNDTARLHHDIAPMPNGNIMMISWELKTEEEAIQAGRKPGSLVQQKLWPDYLLEVNPQTNEVVWEWHVWDHLIQDADSTKDNFGVVADHPELVDINWDTNDGRPSWMHTNALDYNPVLDQVVLSSPYFHEIWIIDHSTTTEEAASHEGGNSGRGGDLLYRWGNPAAYQRGSAEDQQLFFSHDINWIDPLAEIGSEDFGRFAVFNNRVGESYSTGNIFSTNFDPIEYRYSMENGVFSPLDFDRTIKHPIDSSRMYSQIVSSTQILPNGNALLCSGRWGYALEVTPQDELVWEYRVPLTAGQRATQGDTLGINSNLTFRLERYGVDFPGFTDKDLSFQGYIELLPNEGFCSAILPIDEKLSTDIHIFPNPSYRFFRIETNQSSKKQIQVFDALGREVFREDTFEDSFTVRTDSWKPGLYLVKVAGFVMKKVLVY